jgi:hypothetical protein
VRYSWAPLTSTLELTEPVKAIYYLKARLRGTSPDGAKAADFYIEADNQPDAGAMAHDFCREHWWVFDAYLALPQVVDPLEDGWVSTEAVSEARRSGISVVFSELEPGEDE